MKNENDKVITPPARSKKQRGGPKPQKQPFLEGGDGANKNDDRSEDSKGGGSRGLGNQKGANQGFYEGGRGSGKR